MPRALPPQPLKQAYFSGIEKEINRIFYEFLYARLATVLGVKEISNSAPRDPLVAAIRSGRVWFDDGIFEGSFNAAISKRLRAIGARYRPASGTWSFAGALPADISIANAQAAAAYNEMRSSILAELGRLDLNAINNLSGVPDEIVRSIKMIDTSWKDSVASVSIAPNLSETQLGNLAAAWGQNLDLYIKNWLSENIIELRQKVMSSTFSGARASSLEKMIRDNYGVSRNKAKFLARQETALLMSKFHEERYADIGINKYRWEGAMDERERPDHRVLQGKVFSYSNPPIVDVRTGRRANPGEDFGLPMRGDPVDRLKADASLKWAIEMLEKAGAERHFGTLTFSMQNGQITHLDVKTSLKPPPG